jgi:hypothetical protein
MYRPPPLDRDLLQGDVLRAVPIIEEATVDHRPLEGPLEDLQQEARSRVSHRMVVILSHSCDTTPRTPMGNPVVVSPLKEIAPHFHEQVRAQGGTERINSLADPTFLNWFYFAPTDALGGREWLVDFTRMQSVRFAKLQSAVKLTELTNEAREALKFKIHLNFCRPEDTPNPAP